MSLDRGGVKDELWQTMAFEGFAKVQELVPGGVALDEASGYTKAPIIGNQDHQTQPVEIRIDSTRIADGPAASVLVLISDRAMDENSLDQPEPVAPKTVAVTVKQGRIWQQLDTNSFMVIRLKMQR